MENKDSTNGIIKQTALVIMEKITKKRCLFKKNRRLITIVDPTCFFGCNYKETTQIPVFQCSKAFKKQISKARLLRHEPQEDGKYVDQSFAFVFGKRFRLDLYIHFFSLDLASSVVSILDMSETTDMLSDNFEQLRKLTQTFSDFIPEEQMQNNKILWIARLPQESVSSLQVFFHLSKSNKVDSIILDSGFFFELQNENNLE